jgi:hypothetical protein
MIRHALLSDQQQVGAIGGIETARSMVLFNRCCLYRDGRAMLVVEEACHQNAPTTSRC